MGKADADDGNKGHDVAETYTGLRDQIFALRTTEVRSLLRDSPIVAVLMETGPTACRIVGAGRLA